MQVMPINNNCNSNNSFGELNISPEVLKRYGSSKQRGKLAEWQFQLLDTKKWDLNLDIVNKKLKMVFLSKQLRPFDIKPVDYIFPIKVNKNLSHYNNVWIEDYDSAKHIRTITSMKCNDIIAAEESKSEITKIFRQQRFKFGFNKIASAVQAVEALEKMDLIV